MSKVGSRVKNNTKKKSIPPKKTTKKVSSKKTNNKKVKIKYGRLLLFLVIIGLLGCVIVNLFKFNITNIYISGNTIYSDQQIIEKAGLENYPSTFEANFIVLSNRLEKDIYIKKATITKKFLMKVYIKIEENRPILYNDNTKKTVLGDKTETDDLFTVPVLINYVPESIYDKFIKKMNIVDIDILKRISEIKYEPNDVDEERFLFTMNDGNYVYINIYNLSKINSYVEIIEKVNNKKGVLNLDAGGHFTIID